MAFSTNALESEALDTRLTIAKKLRPVILMQNDKPCLIRNKVLVFFLGHVVYSKDN